MPKTNPQVQVPIEWNIPDNLVARYATNMVVQRLENEFLISFFEIKPPIILGEPDKIESRLKELKSLRADCVAQIIVAEDKMPSFVGALESNLKRFFEHNAADEEKE
ncbi:MAG: hypothetical protein KKC71_09410 [Chloroflexi bacterium]|nr:hypothetical protein [Chloroflexota bacterium]